MAAPTYVQSTAGGVWTTGAALSQSLTGVTVGNVVLITYLVDGASTGSNSPSFSAGGESLSGTAGSFTAITGSNGENVGNPTVAGVAAFIGRATASTVTYSIIGAGDDLYVTMHEFATVSAGTTLATVIENGTAGSYAAEAGTGTSVTDVGVTTLGADRLAINVVGINDDLTGIAAFAGASGGTWSMPKSFESSTGTDGTISLMTAEMASAGTINGGSDTITSDAWGVVGFALIGATSAEPSLNPNSMRRRTNLQAVKRTSYFCFGDLWSRRRSGLLVPG